MIAINLSKQQVLGADPRTIQHIKFTGNVDHEQIQQCPSFLKKQKKLFYTFDKEL